MAHVHKALDYSKDKACISTAVEARRGPNPAEHIGEDLEENTIPTKGSKFLDGLTDALCVQLTADEDIVADGEVFAEVR